MGAKAAGAPGAIGNGAGLVEETGAAADIGADGNREGSCKIGRDVGGNGAARPEKLGTVV